MSFENTDHIVDVDKNKPELSRNEDNFRGLEEYLTQEKNRGAIGLGMDINYTIKDINQKVKGLSKEDKDKFLSDADHLVDVAIHDYVEKGKFFFVELDSILPKNTDGEKAKDFIAKKETQKFQKQNLPKQDGFFTKLASAIIPNSVNKHNQDLNDAMQMLEKGK